MYHWNQSNFEGLAQLAAQLRTDSRLNELARYCELRETGLRREAFQALDNFLAAALSSTIEEQRELAIHVLGAHARITAAHQFLSHPLKERFLVPVLNAWCMAEPRNPIPFGELGVLQRDADTLRQALEFAPANDRVRRCLTALVLGYVDFATHHLAESILIGPFEDACGALDLAESYISSATHPSSLEDLKTAVKEYRDLLGDWDQYRQNPAGTFPQWCTERGRLHRWSNIYYYQP